MLQPPLGLHILCQKLCEAPLTLKELSLLASLCTRLSSAQLKLRMKHGLTLFDTSGRSNPEIQAIAMDAISDLFERDDKMVLIRFQRYFIPLRELIMNDADAMIALRKLITSKTTQGLYRIFKERDPESAKLLRNIKLAVLKSNHFYLYEDFRGTYVHTQRATPVRLSCIHMSTQEISQLYGKFSVGDTIPELLSKTWQCMTEVREDNFAAEIHELMVVVRNFRNQQPREAMADLCRVEDALLRETAQMGAAKAQKSVNDIIFRYGVQNKLSSSECQVLQRAIKCWTTDLLDGGVQPGLTYFCHEGMDIDRLTFRDRYQTKFEYLIRVVIGELRMQLADYSED